VASEIRQRFPQLAERALGPAEEIARGFVIVVNDEVVTRPDPSMRLRTGDELCLITALAGG
jgi:molybdopterin converting factor small subunit